MADPRDLFAGLHAQTILELNQLMSGFYHNIEDGLFEMAYANDDQNYQRHLIELMRELRFRREQLLKTFTKRVQNAGQGWLSTCDGGTERIEERVVANSMAAKCAAHFAPVLQAIAERTGHATNRAVERKTLPSGPEELSYHFLMSCRSVSFDTHSVEMVQDLFGRFVLDRLGGTYGQINFALEESGYCTNEQDAELDEFALSSA